MAFDVTFTIQDAYSRQGKKQFEGVDTTLAAAEASAAALLSDFNALSTAGVVRETYSSESLVFQSAQPGANLDAGAHIQCRLNNGKLYSFAIPAIDMSVVNVDGSVDIAAQAVTDFIANFESGGKYRVSEGNYVVQILSGKLDR